MVCQLVPANMKHPDTREWMRPSPVNCRRPVILLLEAEKLTSIRLFGLAQNLTLGAIRYCNSVIVAGWQW